MLNQHKAYYLSSAGSLVLLAAGCMPGDFDDFAKLAPVRVHNMPSSELKEADYGSVLASLRTKQGSDEVSYLAASGGRGSAIVLTEAWNGSRPDEEHVQRCGAENECSDGAQDVGGTLIPFQTWGFGGEDERSTCVFSPVNFTMEGKATPLGYIACESNKSPQKFGLALGTVLASGESLHFSGFGLPEGHPLGVVLFGAYAKQDRAGVAGPHSGGLFRVPDRYQVEANTLSARRMRLNNPGGEGEQATFSDDPERQNLGREVVGTFTKDGELLVAISQPAKQRVIVVAYDEASKAPVEERLVTRACIESPDPDLLGFGERLAFGDVTGDGKPELFVGSDPVLGVQVGKQALFMYDGGGLPPASAARDRCPAWGDDAVAVTCRDQDGLRCNDSAFGAALAIGDVDGDGRGDLIVGAPETAVDGVAAGAVWIVPGAAKGLDAGRSVTLVSPGARGRFGTSVAALLSKSGRAEPAVGAPGLNKVFVYMCTPLEAQFEGDTYCLP